MKKALMMLLLLAGLTASAKELIWNGTETEPYWTQVGNQTVFSNWTNAVGEAKSFEVGDTVYFTDAAECKVVQIASASDAQHKPTKIIFDHTQDYELKACASDAPEIGMGGYSRLGGTIAFEKYGSGMLTMSQYHTFTGDVLVDGGCLYLTKAVGLEWYQRMNSTLGLLNDANGRVVTVRNGGTLLLASAAEKSQDATVFGDILIGSEAFVPDVTIVVTNSTLSFKGDHWTGGDTCVFGPLKFYNAKLMNLPVAGISGWSQSSLYFRRDIEFKGDPGFEGMEGSGVPYEITSKDVSFGCGVEQPSSLLVDDITGDDVSDVVFSGTIVDDKRCGLPTTFVKKGAGTLELSNAGSTFTGDVVVDGGTLKLSAYTQNPNASAIGNLNTNRTLTVQNGGVLRFGLYAQDQTTFGPVSYNGEPFVPKLTTIVTNATIDFIRKDSWGHLKAISIFGPLTLYNAKFKNLSEQGEGGWDLSSFYFRGDVKFKGDPGFEGVEGSGVPYEITSKDVSFGGGNLIPMPYVIVDDITEDVRADVVFSGRIIDAGSLMSGDDVKPEVPTTFGKKGAGTLALTAANTYTGATIVEEGTLCVDGSVVSPVTVKAGGGVSGVGTISSLTLEDGGAFDIDYNNPEKNALNVATLNLPASGRGVVRVKGYQGDIMELRVANLPLLNNLPGSAAIDMSKWEVVVEGYTGVDKEAKNVVVQNSAAGVTVKYLRRGLVILFK